MCIKHVLMSKSRIRRSSFVRDAIFKLLLPPIKLNRNYIVLKIRLNNKKYKMKLTSIKQTESTLRSYALIEGSSIKTTNWLSCFVNSNKNTFIMCSMMVNLGFHLTIAFYSCIQNYYRLKIKRNLNPVTMP